MLKRIISLTVVVFLCFGIVFSGNMPVVNAATAAPGTNVIPNPGFESATNDWGDWGNSGIVGGNAHSGSCSMRVGVGSGGTGASTYDITPGSTYTASSWGKCSDANGAILGYKCYDENNAEIAGGTTAAFTSSYEQRSITFTAPGNTTSIMVFFWKNAGSDYAYFDDVSLVEKAQITGSKTYYVATTGDDTNGDGSLENPWKTIQKAADVMVAGDTCEIRGGVYRETVVPANSGIAGAENGNITFKNYANENVTISGADIIAGWTHDATTSDAVYKADMPWNLGTGNQIFVANTMMTEARWPNNAGTLIAPTLAIADDGTVNTLKDSELPGDADDYYKGAKLLVGSGADWNTYCDAVTGYSTATKTLTTDHTGSNVYTDVTKDNTYYLFGLKKLLDTENEWWYDSENGELYLWAPGSADPSALTVEAKRRKYGFDLSGRNNIVIDGINLFSTSLKTDDNSSNLLIENMKAEYISQEYCASGYASDADDGILINGSNNEVNSCEFAYSATALVHMSGTGHKLYNCYLRDADYNGGWSASVDVDGSYMHISHNTIDGAGRACIYGHWKITNSIIEYNELSNAGLLTKDVGIIYLLNHDGKGTEIRYNKIHDIASHFGMGVYMDSSNSGYIIHHNVIWNTAWDGIRLNTPGNFSLVFNNTCVNCGNFAPAGMYNLFGSRLYNNIMTGVASVPSEANKTLGWGNNIINSADPGLVDIDHHDFRLKADSVAVDAGKVIPGITDNYSGTAPDIGAYEFGSDDFSVGHDFVNPPAIADFQFTTNPFNNLLVNGDFGLGNLTGWTPAGTASLIQAISFLTPASIVRNQDYGVQLGQNDKIEQVVTGLAPNTKYTVSGWMRLAANSTGTVTLGVKDYGGDPVKKTVSGTDWTQQTIDITTGSADTSATIFVQNASESNVIGYADDISLSLPIAYSSIGDDFNTALVAARTLLASAQSLIPDGIKNSFQNVIDASNAVLGNQSATEDELTNALNTLIEAAKVFKARDTLAKDCATVQAFSDPIVATGNLYEYPVGSKAKLQVAIDHAKLMMSDEVSSLDGLDSEKTALDWALVIFKSSTVKPDIFSLPPEDFANMPVILSDTTTANFSYDTGAAATTQDGYSVFSDEVSRYTGQTYTDGIFKFDMTYDFISPGGWPGFMLRSQGTQGYFGDSDTYLILFTVHGWELHKFQSWSDNLNTFIPNTIVNESNKKYTVTVGCLNTPVGVRLLAYVDGTMVFDLIDNNNPITNAGYFGMVSSGSSTSDIKIKVIESGDKTALENLVNSATSLAASAVEGDLPGQYKAGSKAAFEAVITKAANIVSAPAYIVTQGDVDTAIADLNTAKDLFANNIIPSTPTATPTPTPIPTPTDAPTHTTVSAPTPIPPAYNTSVKGDGTAENTLPVAVDSKKGSATVSLGALANNVFSAEGTTVVNMPSIPGMNMYSLAIPADSLSSSAEKGRLTFATDKGSITIPANLLDGVAGKEGKEAGINIAQGTKANLSDEVKASIGDRPLVQLTLTLDGKQTDWNNSNAPVTISIPYKPTIAELANPEGIVIWYIDGNGKAVSVPNGHYDPTTGTVIFSTTHFSQYAIAYVNAAFKDVAASAWYGKAVNFIAARGITAGTGNGNYSPVSNLTRGEFIVMLMRAYGISPDAASKDNFSDAGSTYYTGYLAAAKRLGISEGVGNNMYAPGRQITRQEMFVLLYNTLKLIGKLPQGNSGKLLSSFSDAGQIDSWAKDAITLLVETGTISGNNGKLSPVDVTTRAEMAQVLYKMLSK